MARVEGNPLTNDPRKTPFLALLLYVLGFMAALAVLAYLTAWLLHHR